MDRNEALRALDAVDFTEKTMADRISWPLWFHASFGLAEGLIVTGLASDRAGMTAVAGGAAIIALLAYHTRKSGVFVSGYRRGRTLPLTMAIIGFLLAAFAVGMIIINGRPDDLPLAIGLGAFVTLVLTLASMWWERIYRRELREGGAA